MNTKAKSVRYDHKIKNLAANFFQRHNLKMGKDPEQLYNDSEKFKRKFKKIQKP